MFDSLSYLYETFFKITMYDGFDVLQVNIGDVNYAVFGLIKHGNQFVHPHIEHLY